MECQSGYRISKEIFGAEVPDLGEGPGGPRPLASHQQGTSHQTPQFFG